MKTLGLMVLVLVGLAGSAAAQPHYCDTTGPNTLTVTYNPGGTYTLNWCHDPRSANNPQDVKIPSGWAIYVNGQRGTLSGVVKSATPNAAGAFHYSAPTGVPVVGTHVYEIAATYTTDVYPAGESGKSIPFSLTVNPAPIPFAPKSPVSLRVVVG